MATNNVTPFPGVKEPGGNGPTDCDTAVRIREYLLSVRLQRGTDPSADEQALIEQGRELIERMADKSRGLAYPDVQLTAQECARVLTFLTWVEPRKPATWWEDPPEGPSPVTGFLLVLETLKCSLESAWEVRQ